jgi:hypothetical protein
MFKYRSTRDDELSIPQSDKEKKRKRQRDEEIE